MIPWIRAREWGKAIAAFAIALVLGVPALLSGIEHYPFGLDPALSLRNLSPILFGVVAIVAVLVAVALGTSRLKWVAAAVAVIASRPSLVLYDVGYLLAGLPDEPSRPSARRATGGRGCSPRQYPTG